MINLSNFLISSKTYTSSLALSSCSKCPFIGMNTPGVPYALTSSMVDLPASDTMTSAAKIISCRLLTNPKFFIESLNFLLKDEPETTTISRS